MLRKTYLGYVTPGEWRWIDPIVCHLRYLTKITGDDLYRLCEQPFDQIARMPLNHRDYAGWLG